MPTVPRRHTRAPSLLDVAAVLAAAPMSAQTPGRPLQLAARFEKDRIFVRPITEAGDTLDLLFDTGATTVLTDSAAVESGGAQVRGASFIARGVFDRWRRRHPDWRGWSAPSAAPAPT